jgi:hypothetical protein
VLKIADTTRDASFLRQAGIDAHADRASMVPERRLELEDALIANEPMPSLPPRPSGWAERRGWSPARRRCFHFWQGT